MEQKKKQLLFASNLQTIDNVYELKKIGAGHDGIVFQYEDKAIKLLKYDIDTRKNEDLMSFEKAKFFIEWSHEFKRLVAPKDILLDPDGIFCAYAMDLINTIDLIGNSINDIPINVFLNSIYELHEDFETLNKMHTIVKDINSGSYLYSQDFLHLCDMDKYIVFKDKRSTYVHNSEKYNYVIAKLLYSLMYKSLDKSERRTLNKWVSNCSKDLSFLDNLSKELIPIQKEPLGNYTNYLKRTLIKKN